MIVTGLALYGEGEVSVVLGAEYQAQESVLAGVWRVRQTASDGTRLSDRVDIGAFPAGFLGATLARAKPCLLYTSRCV